jgi:hypothetical protein
MPYLVNGQLVPEELVREEFGRIGRDPQWQSIPDLTERANRLRAAAEQSAQDRMLIEQIAAGAPLRLAFPAAFAARWMPGLFPEKPS